MGDVVQASPTHTFVRDAITGTPALESRFTPADGVAGTRRTACDAPVGTAIQVEKKSAGHWWPVISTPINDFRQGARMEQVPSLPAGELDAIVVLDQSNGSGRGTADPGIDPYPQNGERLFYLGPEMNFISPPTEPIDADGTYPVFTALSEGVAVGYGYAVALAHYLSAKPSWSSRNIVICVCAKGGSSSTDWLRSTSLASIYGSAMARMLFLTRHATIRAIIIGQGEADAVSAPSWDTNWRATIANIRTDLALPSVPVGIVQLGSTPATGLETHWPTVRSQQASVGADAGNFLVTAPSATLDGLLHRDTPEQLALGSDLADAIDAAVTL